jgi:hypothetical protein
MRWILSSFMVMATSIPSELPSQVDTAGTKMVVEAIAAVQRVHYANERVSVLPSGNAAVDLAIRQSLRLAVLKDDSEAKVRLRLGSVETRGDSATVLIEAFVRWHPTKRAQLQTSLISFARIQGGWRVVKVEMIEVS